MKHHRTFFALLAVFAIVAMDGFAQSTITATYGKGNGTFYNASGSPSYSGTYVDLYPGINIVELHKTGTGGGTIKFSQTSGAEGVMTLSTLDYYKGFNDALSIVKSGEYDYSSDLLEKLRTMDASRDFYYNCKIDNTKIIETDDMLSPYALYDANNRANKFTLSQIEFSDDVINIDVVRSSRL